MRLPRFRRTALILNLMAALVALAMIWLPEFRAHWASPLLVSEDTASRARMEPPEALLRQIADQSLGLPLAGSGTTDGRSPAIVAMADRLLEGRVQFPRMPAVPVIVPFDEKNLINGPPTHQLYVASLATADILLRAYRQSGNERYLRAASEEISSFAKIDRWRQLPIGMLWNDHALAATIPVLADYWSAIRNRGDLENDHAREVLSLAARTATRLSRAENYTYRTNHGLMQSVALLQFAAAFSSLDGSRALRDLACARIAEQADYYLSPEGPVLEHSSGYHMLGLYLFKILEQLGPAHGCAPIPRIVESLQRAREFASLLRRPDGTVPPLGNTDLAENYETSIVGAEAPLAAAGFYPASGFAVRWTGLEKWPNSASLTQTAMTWSNFPSRAHKLADDLSLLVWARGEDWLVNTGYWPYGFRGEHSARSWPGSNAPHLQGEASESPRRSILRGHAETARVWSIDVERTSQVPGDTIRRQVIAIDGRTWLVIDSSRTEVDRPLRSVWSFPPDKRVTTISASDYLIRSPMTENAARMTMLAPQGLHTENRRGSLSPFAGWVVRNGAPTATEAIVMQNGSARKLSITVLLIGDHRDLASLTVPTLREDSTAENWEVAMGDGWGAERVRSGNGHVQVDFAAGDIQRLALAADFAEADRTRASIVASYERAAARHDRIPYLLPWRYRVTWLLLALLAAQELVMFAMRRAMPAAVPAMRFAAGIAWIVVGLLAANWYLVK